MEHITPTPGRIVWYRGGDGVIRSATVAAVHGPFCVNLHVFGLNSGDVEAGYRSSVPHADPEIEPNCFPSWHWMPYQIGQAKKHANEVARADEPKLASTDTSNEAIEQEIQAKDLTAPRVTPADQRALIDEIARVCHEVNRAYCQALGDHSQLSWENAPVWQRESVRMGVDLHLMGDFGPEATHILWMKQKLDDGWTCGPVKIPGLKQHPSLVPFDQLPREQRAKNYMFRAIVHALR